MRNVPCSNTETEEDGFRLGSLTLKALGNDVEEQIVALANRKIIDFDPFESTISMSVDPQPIAARLSELVGKPVENGFPRERKEEPFEVATRYDISRL
ncbi:unnamed protein product [Phytophthora fragariaefolia]|uniref:Unnamed protein product n=1 Tax=Phytophthora fragariaefolia TaxID=1490495 RepID=A0A9W6XXB9_9STRA|nr:unnamed protein product [Phytophthora fragariaefolia]